MSADGQQPAPATTSLNQKVFASQVPCLSGFESAPRSHQRVACPICKKELRRDELRKHFATQHKQHELVSETQEEADRERSSSKPLTAFFQRRQLRPAKRARKESDGDDSASQGTLFCKPEHKKACATSW